MSIWDQPEEEEIWLVGISGRLDQDQTDTLQTLLYRLIAEGHLWLIVDLTEVSYVNSGGLRCLVSGWRETQSLGGSLVLCGLNPRVAQVFSIVGFDKVFHIFPTSVEAKHHLSKTLPD